MRKAASAWFTRFISILEIHLTHVRDVAFCQASFFSITPQSSAHFINRLCGLIVQSRHSDLEGTSLIIESRIAGDGPLNLTSNYTRTYVDVLPTQSATRGTEHGLRYGPIAASIPRYKLLNLGAKLNYLNFLLQFRHEIKSVMSPWCSIKV